MLNKKVLLLGSTGQIGKELSLLIKGNKNIDLICHARTKVSAAFFSNNNIKSVISDFKSEVLRSEIRTADLIFDLAAPTNGNLKDTKIFYQERINYLMEHIKPETKFIFASSMNAFGLSEQNNKLKSYIIPSSVYAANKRFAENLIINITKQKNIESYIVRLGHVHGNFQKVSVYLKNLISNEYIFEIPNTPAWIVFISSIYEMLINILGNKEKPGQYTLVNDEIFWPDLLEYLGNKINKKPKYRLIGKKTNKISLVKDFFKNFLFSKRDLIRGNYSFSKNFEISKKIEHLESKAKLAYKILEGKKIYNGLNVYEGILPGKRFKNITKKKEIIFQSGHNGNFNIDISVD